jgi:hypothetical protein
MVGNSPRISAVAVDCIYVRSLESRFVRGRFSLPVFIMAVIFRTSMKNKAPHILYERRQRSAPTTDQEPSCRRNQGPSPQQLEHGDQRATCQRHSPHLLPCLAVPPRRLEASYGRAQAVPDRVGCGLVWGAVCFCSTATRAPAASETHRCRVTPGAELEHRRR